MRHEAAWVLAVCVMGVFFTAPTYGQGESPAALRQEVRALRLEVESLTTRLSELQAEHEAALAEIERLRRVIAVRGRRTGMPGSTDGGPAGATPGKPGAGVPERWSGQMDPLSSPEALYVAVSVSYSEAIWDKAPADALKGNEDAWLPDPGDVRAWAAAVADRLEGQSEWLTRLALLEAEEPDEPRRALVTVLDPATLGAISEPFRVEIPERFAGRIENETARAEGEGETLLWRLLVTVRPEPVFDPARERAGPFNYPLFIGPYAGFDFDVKIRGVGVLTESEARERAAETPRPEGNGER